MPTPIEGKKTPAPVKWTDAEVEKLRRLIEVELLTFGEAAKQMGRTRNAVIGKAERVGIKAKLSSAERSRMQAMTQAREARKPPKTELCKKRVRKPAPALKPIDQVPFHPPDPVVSGHTVQLMALRHDMCRWPLGDPRHPDFCYCGETAVFDKPYCRGHMQLAYVPAKPKVRKWRVRQL